jgi:hypothetical protein
LRCALGVKAACSCCPRWAMPACMPQSLRRRRGPFLCILNAMRTLGAASENNIAPDTKAEFQVQSLGAHSLFWKGGSFDLPLPCLSDPADRFARKSRKGRRVQKNDLPAPGRSGVRRPEPAAPSDFIGIHFHIFIPLGADMHASRRQSKTDRANCQRAQWHSPYKNGDRPAATPFPTYGQLDSCKNPYRRRPQP